MWFPVNFICFFINCFHGINVCLYTVFLIFIMLGQLETTLGTFYAPKYPLSEVVILDFRDPISRLARRFFHHLLRYIQKSYPPCRIPEFFIYRHYETWSKFFGYRYMDFLFQFIYTLIFSSFRYSRFDKAFLLAVDIGARDLFMVSKTLNSHWQYV